VSNGLSLVPGVVCAEFVSLGYFIDTYIHAPSMALDCDATQRYECGAVCVSGAVHGESFLRTGAQREPSSFILLRTPQAGWVAWGGSPSKEKTEYHVDGGRG